MWQSGQYLSMSSGAFLKGIRVIFVKWGLMRADLPWRRMQWIWREGGARRGLLGESRDRESDLVLGLSIAR
jgi:hypothetical protein